MVSTLTVPKVEAKPVVEGLQELGKRMQADGVVIPEDEDGGGAEDGEGPHAGDPVGEGCEDPMQVGEDADRWDIPAEDQEAMRKEEARWREFMQERDEVEMSTITWAVPVKSRHADEIVATAAQVYARIRSLQIPVVRVHLDRAREFTGRTFRRWLQNRGLYVTYTAGDEPCGNSRTEREVGYLKNRVRTLLTGVRAPMELWPLALRHAAEERMRRQLTQLGVPCPKLIPFGAKVMVRKKTWFNRSQDWKFPMEAATCYGPAGDMSLTSGGYVLQTANGQWIRSTVVVQPRDWQALEDRAEGSAAEPGELVGEAGTEDTPEEGEAVIMEEVRPMFVLCPSDPPQQRVRGKQPPRLQGQENRQPVQKYRLTGKTEGTQLYRTPTASRPSLNMVREGGGVLHVFNG